MGAFADAFRDAVRHMRTARALATYAVTLGDPPAAVYLALRFPITTEDAKRRLDDAGGDIALAQVRLRLDMEEGQL